MEIILETIKNESVIKLSGEIDMSNYNSIKEKILSFNLKDVILDFKNVTYLDSSGIGMLISLKKHCQFSGGGLKIINIDAKIKKLLNMVGLTKILDIE